jgi:hypothetical protein
MHLIGQEDANRTHSSGDAYLTVEGGAPVLDDMHLKNVVIRNAFVVYNGGKLELENVYFINCTFQIAKNDNGKSFLGNLVSFGPEHRFKVA